MGSVIGLALFIYIYNLYWVEGIVIKGSIFSKLITLTNLNEPTSHWVKQRLTSIILLPLALLFLIPFTKHIGLDHTEVIMIYKNPWRAIIAFLFLGVTFIHIQQGLQVVIEDYVYTDKNRKLFLFINLIFCGFMILCTLFSAVKIVLS